MHSKQTDRLALLLRVVSLMIGAALASVGLEIFLVPDDIIDGGVVGISIIASHLSGLPLGLFTFALNIPFFVVGYKQIGRTFTLSTFFSVACLSIGVSLLHPIPGLTHDPLLAAVFGGIINGTGVGLIIRNGGSLDGTEITAIILERKLSFSIGEIVMFFNLFILSSAGFVFGWDRAMYSLIAYFIASKAIDIVTEGIDETRSIMVIADHEEDITSAINDRLGRSVTVLSGKGGYSGEAVNVLYVVVSRLEVSKLRSIVHQFDQNALVTVGNVDSWGKHFKKRNIH